MAKRDTIDTRVCVKLTIAEFNEVQCFLTEAQRWNIEQGYPATSSTVGSMKEKLYAQVSRERVAEAFAKLRKEMEIAKAAERAMAEATAAAA